MTEVTTGDAVRMAGGTGAPAPPDPVLPGAIPPLPRVPFPPVPAERSALVTCLVKHAAGLGLSIVLTLASFWAARTGTIWAQGLPVLLAALAIAQVGVRLVFFLHVSSGPEGANGIIALAFGASLSRWSGSARSSSSKTSTRT